MSKKLEQILEKLNGVEKYGKGHRALCPCHNDHKPSLFVTEVSDGRILMNCRAGCKTTDILAKLGFTMADLFPDASEGTNKTIEETYDYQNKDGNLLFQVIRYKPKDFRARRPDGNGGWIWSKEGITPVLYHLPDVSRAVNSGTTIYLPEGEKDCDNLWDVGLIATTAPFGASSHWLSEYTDTLSGAKQVVVLPDNDEPGRKHVEDIVQKLHGKVESLKVVELPGLNIGGDITDWLKDGHTPDDLRQIVETTPERNPSIPQPIHKGDGWIDGNLEGNNRTRPSPLTPSLGTLRFISAQEAVEIDSHGLEPLWPPFLYPQSIHILNSVAGVGKTTLCYNLAICGAKGESFANISFKKPLNIIYADLETSQALRATKLKLLSEDDQPGNLWFLSCLNFIDNRDELEKFVKEKNIDLTIIDTINEAFSTKDEQDNAEANKQSSFLKNLRDETGCSILLLAHIGKGEQSHKVYSTRGASARAASVDVVLNLTERTEDEICLAKEKDRIGGGKEKLYLRKAGEDAFEVVEHSEDMETSLLVRVQSFILEKLDMGLTHTREFIEEGAKLSYSKPTVERALSNLYHAGKIDRPKKGVYVKIVETPSDNNHSGDILKEDGCDIPPKIENPSIKETINPSINNKYSMMDLRDSQEKEPEVDSNWLLREALALDGRIVPPDEQEKILGQRPHWMPQPLSRKKTEEILGMAKDEAIAIWRRNGKPEITLKPWNKVSDLEKFLNATPKEWQLKVIGEWLGKL
jgi:hypothetical protein